MKNQTKVLLTILILLILSLSSLVYWQQENISALINSLKYSSEDLAVKMDSTREKLQSEVEKYTSKPIIDITAEDEQKLLKGEITIEDVADKYNLPIEYMKDDYETDSEKAKNTTKDNIQQNYVDVTSNTQVITETNKDNKDEIDAAISEGVSKMYALKAKYVNKLGELERELYKEYTSLPKEKQNKDSKYNIVMENIDYVASLEEKCDNEVAEVVSQLEDELNKLNANTEIIQILKDAYEEEKELKKAYYVSLYND